MRVRILCLVLLGLMMTPFAGSAKGSQQDPDGVFQDTAITTFGTEPLPTVDLNVLPSSSIEQPTSAEPRPQQTYSETEASGSLVDAFLHWLAALMQSV